jgi:hypothetical protein
MCTCMFEIVTLNMFSLSITINYHYDFGSSKTITTNTKMANNKSNLYTYKIRLNSSVFTYIFIKK